MMNYRVDCTSWRIHLGAHKTATTHLQDNLAARHAELAAAGVDFLPRPLLRATDFPPHLGSHAWKWRLLPVVGRRALAAGLSPLRTGPDTLAISEEDLLGNAFGLIETPFYRHAVGKLRWLDLLPTRQGAVRLFLSIRGFDALLPSAYAQILRTQTVPGGFGPIRAAALKRPPSWTNLVSRLRAAYPHLALTVWTFEDYRRDATAVFEAFCGVPLSEVPLLPPSDSTRSPTATAISRIEGLSRSLDRAAHMISAARIIEEEAKGERFMPFSEGERRVLIEAYEEDLEALRARFPNVMIGLPEGDATRRTVSETGG